MMDFGGVENLHDGVDPRCYCTHCGKAAAKFRCSSCQFAYFCDKSCLKACWKSHKIYCKSLPEAVDLAIVEARPSLKKLYLVQESDALSCWLCLSPGTGSDPLYRMGCSCRPTSGNSLAHIGCHKDYAKNICKNELARLKKKKNHELESSDLLETLVQCVNCRQPRAGILLFEMLVEAWKDFDDQVLVRKFNSSIVYEYSMTALNLLDHCLCQHTATASSLSKYTRIRVLWRKWDLTNYALARTNKFKKDQIYNEQIGISLQIASAVQLFGNIHQATYINRRAFSFAQKTNSRMLIPTAVSLARSLLTLADLKHISYQDSQTYLREAETLLSQIIHSPTAQSQSLDTEMIMYRYHYVLCLIRLKKFQQAKTLFPPLYSDAKQVLGTTHPLTLQIHALNYELQQSGL